MSDLDDLRGLLDRWDVAYKVAAPASGVHISLRVPDNHNDRTAIQGYGGFETVFCFDADGTFDSVEIVE